MNGMLRAFGMFLDPVALTAWCLVALSWMLWRRPSVGRVRWFSAVLTLFFFLMGSPYCANWVVEALEQQAQAEPRCDAPTSANRILVLAGGISGIPQTTDEFERLKDASSRRTIAATRLAQSLPGSILIVSGGGGDRIREADLMAGFARGLGLPASRIVIERESTNTYQSATALPAMLPDIKSHPIYLVTSAIHIPRAVGVFRSEGYQICAYPADFRTIDVPFGEGLVPRVTAMLKSADAYHEVIGLLWYRLRGRLA